MNKNFNQEYKDLMEQEVPDLWNRIEPSLRDKKSAPEEIKIDSKIDSKMKIIKFPITRIMKYTGVLAACVCLVILIPIFISGTKSGNKYQENSQAEMDSAYESEEVSEATQEIMEETTEEAMDEPQSDSADNVGNEVLEEAPVSEEATVGDEMKDSEVIVEAPMDVGETVFEGVQVYIISIKQLSELSFSYQVEIANVDHDEFLEGLEIIINAQTQEMKKGRTYTVSIIGDIPSNSGNDVYNLIEILE